MSILLNGNCLELLEDTEDNSVDLIFCDLPYGQTSKEWDIPIDLELLWVEIMRVKKLHTPIIMTTTTRFGVALITSAPFKCPFRYDIIWCKSASSGFLLAKKMPLRRHESLYVFYEKLPLYDLSSHKHKYKIDAPKTEKVKGGSIYEGTISHEKIYRELKKNEKTKSIYGENPHHSYPEQITTESVYEPPLPNSLIHIKSTKGNHSTEKPVALMEWVLKYYSKEGDIILDPTMGSGSMGVACKKMNRNFIGIELDEEIYERAVSRIET